MRATVPAGCSGSHRSHSPQEPAATGMRWHPAGAGKRTANDCRAWGGVGSHRYFKPGGRLSSDVGGCSL
ncbi:hypothetical protein GCM10027511_30670 [Hymenobacter humi]